MLEGDGDLESALLDDCWRLAESRVLLLVVVARTAGDVGEWLSDEEDDEEEVDELTWLTEWRLLA